MDVHDVITQARDAITVKQVFGEPYEADGVTVIPAAKFVGGAGGGEGERPPEHERGAGSGFGVVARPVGAYLIRGGQVSWRPAVDINRIMLGSQVVMAIALLTIRTIVKARAQARTR